MNVKGSDVSQAEWNAKGDYFDKGDDKRMEDEKARASNPNNDLFWIRRQIERPANSNDAIKLGQEILDREKAAGGGQQTAGVGQ
jgi:two-component SAPR family response regulator